MADNDDPKTPDEEVKDTGDDSQNQDPPKEPDKKPEDKGGSQGDDNPPGEAGDEDKKFSQKELDDLITKRLKEDRQRREREESQKKARESGKHDEVIKSLEADIVELTPKAELADRLAGVVNETIDGEIAKWPKEVKDLDPGKDNVEVRARWVQKSRALAAKLMTPPKPPKTEMDSGGGAGGGGGTADATDTYMTSRYKAPGQK